ncbi:MAG: DUF892 family protein [Phycisphaerales bacterium]|nr:DUF892 family protein [Phycisphaerales bacterium]
MVIRSLEDALCRVMTDLLSAEEEFRGSLGRLADAADDEALADTFRQHRDATSVQIQRLEECFRLMCQEHPRGVSKAAVGIVREAEDLIRQDGEREARDVVLATAGRHCVHYQIVAYSEAIEWARELRRDDVADLLEENLAEEEDTEEALCRIATRLSSDRHHAR